MICFCVSIPAESALPPCSRRSGCGRVPPSCRLRIGSAIKAKRFARLRHRCHRRGKRIRPRVCPIIALVGGTRAGRGRANQRAANRPRTSANRVCGLRGRGRLPCPAASLAIAVSTGWDVTNTARFAPTDGRFRWPRRAAGVTVVATSCPGGDPLYTSGPMASCRYPASAARMAARAPSGVA